MTPIGLYYSDGGYTESSTVAANRQAPSGLMGREVASAEFLNAYLSFGDWEELIAIVADQTSQQSITRYCIEHESSRAKKRRLKCVSTRDFSGIKAPPASLVHYPCPADAKMTWIRQHRQSGLFALSGVTHTLCSKEAIESMRRLVIDPFLPFDRLICTSRCTQQTVKAVTTDYANYLRDRFGGRPRNLTPLEVVPLGVNTSKFRPASPCEKNTARSNYKIQDDEICALFVGRLSHHAKANPFPMYRSLANAVRDSGKKVHLLLAGWSANKTIGDAFRDGAKRFAPNLRCTFVDGMDPTHRRQVWHAADFLISLVDNIQETFGLVVVEAMASGIPVVVSDWNGYRDLVSPDETGFVARTYEFRESDPNLTLRLLTDEINYDQFLGLASQQVIVDVADATKAIVKLVGNADLRREMGAKARARALQHFDWQHVISQYEGIWQAQIKECHAWPATKRDTSYPTPSAYPPLDHAFASYPTTWLQGTETVAAVKSGNVEELLTHGLTSHSISSYGMDKKTINSLLHVSEHGCEVSLLYDRLEKNGVAEEMKKRIVAWMLKYDLIQLVPD